MCYGEDEGGYKVGLHVIVQIVRPVGCYKEDYEQTFRFASMSGGRTVAVIALAATYTNRREKSD